MRDVGTVRAKVWRAAWSLLKDWLLSLLIFSGVAVVMVGQFALANQRPLLDSLPSSAWMAGRDWLPWAILAPFIVRLVARLPLERRRWFIATPVHLVACVAAVAACIWWGETVFPWQNFPRAWSSRPDSRAPTAQRPAASTTENAPARSPSRGPRGPWGRDEQSTFRRYAFLFGFRLPIYLAIVSVAHALHFYRRSQDRERRSLELQASLAQARLEALKMQLQPHFLFNALNGIAALMHKDPEAADEMLAALSDFLRLVLATSGEQELPLRRELELVERYLAIEHARFGDRLQYKVDVSAETEPALVPAFLLQPLVENAVRHGLEPRPGAGSLTIHARREDGKLRLIVADNGVGLVGQQPPREGIGLVNTRARLRELYNGHATLELRSAGGVTVEITLPFHAAA
jgi:signal transduction histidine kinase